MQHSKGTRARLSIIAAFVGVTLAVTVGLSLVPPHSVDAAVASQSRLEQVPTDTKTIATADSTPLVVNATVKQATPIAQPEPAAPLLATARSTNRTATVASKPTATKPATDELTEAKRILAGLIAKHPILAGTTVSFGDARGYQAIALYTSGRIIISPTHTASLSRILNHEVWHIIDWRDNGSIDWGEQVPPR
jgi:hypothetical protein